MIEHHLWDTKEYARNGLENLGLDPDGKSHTQAK